MLSRAREWDGNERQKRIALVQDRLATVSDTAWLFREEETGVSVLFSEISVQINESTFSEPQGQVASQSQNCTSAFLFKD